MCAEEDGKPGYPSSVFEGVDRICRTGGLSGRQHACCLCTEGCLQLRMTREQDTLNNFQPDAPDLNSCSLPAWGHH